MSTKPLQVREEEVTIGDSELPEGWALAHLDEICEAPQYGWTTSAKKSATGLKLLRTTDISSESVNWADVPVCEDEPQDSTKYLLRPGDIVVSRAGSVGLSYLISECPPAIFASYLIRFRPLKPGTSEFIATFLKAPQYWSQIAEETLGIAIPNVNGSKLRMLRIPVPPLAEQRRIVEMIRALLLAIEPALKRLERSRKIIARFRQAVLAAACSGKLTEDWREGSLKGDAISETDLVPEGTDYWPEIPDTWQMKNVEGVCEVIVDCPHSTPKWTEKGEICLRTTNFRPGILDLSEIRFVSEKTYSERVARLEPAVDDVLYSREGGILGIACLFPSNLTACLGQRMMLMRTNRSIIFPVLIMHILNSSFTSAYVRELTTGSASPHLNVGDIKRFAIPVPPMPEQQEILRRVDVLFKLADAIETRVAAASLRAEKLTQAVLAKAFRGKLVPTEAEIARREGRKYEPASVLLERIKGNVSGNGDNAGRRTRTKSRIERGSIPREH